MDAVKLLGSLLGNNATDGNMLGSLIKGAMGGGGSSGGSQNPLGILGGLLGGGGGGAQQQSSGAAGILGSILGGGNAGQPEQQPQSGGGIAGLLGGMLGGSAPAAVQAPPREAVDQATILIRAMCNSAKADGHIDEAEQEKILGRLGDIDKAEAEFLRKELSTPLDVQSFCRSVPDSMAANVYALSAMTVRVDTREEVAYLQQLGQGLNLDNRTLGHIHKELGLA